MQQEQGKYNKKRLLAFTVLVLLIIMIIFLIWWWFVPRSATPEGPVPTAEEPARDTVVLTPQRPAEVPEQQDERPAQEQLGETEIRSLARNFTERYGTWSTDSNFQNLKDLFPRVTNRLESAFQRTIDSSTPPTEFKSVETRVLQIEVRSFTDSAASVSVTAQQVTRNAALEETDAFATLDLTMVKDDEFWYVDSAAWKQ